ncbi:MAG: hypothetical protein CMK59_13550 [Proteobacteria bacterium]|nr:hypothetical protein [Pseudomonadota bacterium]
MLILLLFLINVSKAEDIADPNASSESSKQDDTQSSEGTLFDILLKEQDHEPSAVPAQMAISPQAELTADLRLLLSFYRDPHSLLKPDGLMLDLVDPKDFDIPIVINDEVKKWMRYFLGAGRKHYKVWLSRAGRYTPMMKQKLKEANLPQDLIYLSMIESGFSTHAYSHASAVGLWQFISTTGRENGLRIDWWIDERRSPELATDAAIRFLTRLYKKYDHWYLAWAAYNGGPGRVSRAISAHKINDFWDLVAVNAFPAETDNYVPKIIAAAIVGKYAERYGFSDIKLLKPLVYQETTLGPNYSIASLAKCASIKEEDFLLLNPQLKRWALPPTPSQIKVYIPKDTAFNECVKTIPKSEQGTHTKHTVQKGENLSLIAKKYNVSVTQIQRTNKLKNPNSIRVGAVLIVPVEGSPSKIPAPKKSTTRPSSHTVKKGENLSSIAKKYSIKTADLMSWNNVNNPNKIYVGQKLSLSPPKNIWISYTVKSGDNLSKIAQKHNCTISDIKSWNGIKGNTIYAGQKLKIKKN